MKVLLTHTKTFLSHYAVNMYVIIASNILFIENRSILVKIDAVCCFQPISLNLFRLPKGGTKVWNFQNLHIVALDIILLFLVF